MKDIELARDLFETTPGPCSLGDCIDCQYFNRDNICIELKQAESLIARGYQKIKWHKISEDALPEFDEEVLISYKTKGEGFWTAIGHLSKKVCEEGIIKYWCTDSYGIMDFNGVVAWMELPKYEC